MPSEKERQEAVAGCCLLTLLAFGVGLTVLVFALAVKFL